MAAVRRRRLLAVAWFLPALVLLGVFVYYPIVDNIRLSFFSWSAFSTAPEFVGTQNYRDMVDDPVFWRALKNNVAYAVVSLVFQVAFALVLAGVLEEFVRPRLRTVLRSIYFIPSVISITVAGLLFAFIYNPRFGLLNRLLGVVGLENWQHSWLGEQATAIWSIIAMSQWQSVGYTTVLFCVAIQRIPTEMYEAARVDGAGPIRSFFTITVPMVREMTTLLIILTVSGRLPAVQRGDGHDRGRPRGLQPGPRHLDVPQRVPRRQHGVRRRDRHADLRADARLRGRPAPRGPTPEGGVVNGVDGLRPNPRTTTGFLLVRLVLLRTLTALMLVALAVAVVYPLLWMVFSSFKTNREIFGSPWSLPEELRWDNFTRAGNAGVVRYFVNSILVTAGSIVTTTLISAWAAFGLVRVKAPFSNIATGIILGGLMMAPTVALIPLFGLLQQLHIYDTLWALVILYTAFRIPFTTFLIRAYMIDMPSSIDEAAYIDGATHWQIFWHIVLPLCRPILVSSALLQALFAWNEFAFALVFIATRENKTLPVGLVDMQSRLLTDWPVQFAGLTMAALPMIVLFLIGQRHFLRGLTDGIGK